jgi:predicted secreted protein
MTSAISGLEGSLWVCATVDGSYVKVAEAQNVKAKISSQDIDTTNCDDAGWESGIAGTGSWEASVDANLIMSDAALVILKAAALSRATVYCKILQDGTPTATPVGWSGPAGVSGGDLTLAGPKTQQKGAWTLKGRGALAAI